MLGERLIYLLSLLSQDEFQTADSLATKLKISSKTLRQLIKQLDADLLDNGAHIITKRGQGFQLQVDNFELLQALFIKNDKSPPGNSKERVRFLLDYFLHSHEYVKAEELCDMLYVCKKTLANDLKKVEHLLNEHEIELERKPYYGMKIKGSEFHIRLCIAKCNEMKSGKSNLPDSGNQEELTHISECLLEYLENETYRISDIALQSLIVHIYVAIRRIKSGQYVPLGTEDYHDWVGEDEYHLAVRCVKYLEKQFQISFPEGEIIYIAIHLAGKESETGMGRKDQNLIISNEINKLVREMLNEIYEVFRIDLREDLELMMALGRHIIPLGVRLRYGMKLKNPLLGEIKERYSLAYVMAIQACSPLERHYGKRLDQDEVAYVALALALSLERYRTKQEKKTILLVCASGAGTAKLLAYKMQDMFHDCIEKIITCDEHSVKRQDFSKIDYIFATVPIRAFVPVPICEVKFLMESSDIKAMRHMLVSGKDKKVTDYYPKDLFFGGISLNDKEQVIRFMCDEISKRRSVPAGFYQAVLKREKVAQTYMGNNTAMPHPCKVMTEETFVTVCILNEPIMWNDSEQVQAVFLVSVSKNKNKKIQDFYRVTARLLLNQESMEELIREKNYETLERLIIITSKQ